MNGNRINRRAALRTMLYIAAGTMVLPACFRESGSKTIGLVNMTINEEQELLLAEVVETLIPSSQTPGAKELLLHLFVLKMVDDCHSPEDQRNFTEGLEGFAAMEDPATGTKFINLSPADRLRFLKQIGDQDNDKITMFYSMTKRRCIQGYMNSKNVMTDLKKYELIPGRYIADFKIG
ncbi:MAG: gluconate 2-dehydrogenase subunit 3 family protein [Sphingobacterium sp.]|uniref:gluconate 2-dehydrogenase subunit 3 family protein n=1 Tax=Sphingobacterium sp. JB170 TaxID=1434842 RepID=UPI000B35E7F4|nr:gluconate 2-dehydrogenase subunit 3 family protein [Sphingobacterium sp. JB170]